MFQNFIKMLRLSNVRAAHNHANAVTLATSVLSVYLDSTWTPVFSVRPALPTVKAAYLLTPVKPVSKGTPTRLRAARRVAIR